MTTGPVYLLDIYTAEEREAWLDLHKHGVWRSTVPG